MLVPKLRFKREDGTEYPIWQKKSLNKCATFHSGLTYSPNDVTDSDNGVLVIRSTNIQNGSLVYNDNVFVNVVLSDKLKLRLNDTVMCVRNGSKTLVGKNALVKYEDLDKTWGAFMIVLRSIEPNCFIHHYLNSLYFKRQMDINAGTSTINQITSAMLNECILFVPTDIEEQQKIADFLSAVDEVIAQSEAEVQNLEQQKKAAMQKIFSQEVRFKREDGTEYPEWEEDIISNICTIKTGNSNSQDQVENGEYPFYIRSEIPVKSNRYLFDCEAVLTIGDGNIGKVFHYVNGKFDLHQRVYMMNEFQENVFVKYFYYFFSAFFYKRAMKLNAKGTVNSVRREMIADMIIQIPCLKEQQKIADFLSAYDEAISYAKQELDKWKELKKGLLQQMFV